MSQEETGQIKNETDHQTTADEPVDAESVKTAREETAEQPQPSDAALVQAQKQAQEYLEGWQRERAEFSNYRRRVEQQLKDSYQNASLDMLKSLIPIIDDFERAMTSAPEGLADQPWLNGVMLIYRKFQKLLDDQGVTALDPAGEVFDPNRHEAVGIDDTTDIQSGHVTVTLQKGYAHGERILRPAMVRVAR
ncbi:MAG: nucleotide exchange factor GrpE [Chloroflexi bacterium]|nr:nucleotide exchange factor GrpE [Chloroflexota bacterium]